MILLDVQQVVRQFDADPVLDRVSCEVRPGEKIGLVGPNGTGKTTLLRILAGLDDADQGTVTLHPSARCGLLEQAPEHPAEHSLHDEARAGLAPLYALQRDAEEVAHLIAHQTDPAEHTRLHKRFDTLQQELHRLNAYNLDHKVDEVLQGLGFDRADYERPLGSFSGGQQNRAALARLLLSAPDLLLLDEPTNHLDIATTEWLENYLVASPQAMLIVSHDRFFLDRVTNRILELYRGKITDYAGNFSAYWKQRDERQEVQRRAFEKQQEFIARTEDFIRRNHYGQKHTQAADRERKLERLERIDRPQEIPAPSMGFGKPRRAGDIVLVAENLTQGFGNTPLFRDLTLRIQRGDRLGIYGPNGCGKTTLLRTLVGELRPQQGRVSFGTNVDLAYFDQQLSSVDPARDGIEAIRPANRPQVTPAELRDILARFGMKGEIVLQPVGTLSGGERTKVALSRVAALNANLLVLDEPTNHLDLWARDALESALREYDGTVLFVSHDRYFMDRVATALLAFEADRWRVYEGNYSAYADMLRRRQLEQPPDRTPTAGKTAPANDARKSPSGGAPQRRKRKFPYRKVADIEADIARHEAQLEQLQADLADPLVLRDGSRIHQVQQDFSATQDTLSHLYEHWEEAIELNG